jgi:hypothetical protein
VWVIRAAANRRARAASSHYRQTEKTLRTELVRLWRNCRREALPPVGLARLRARAKSGESDREPCSLSPFAQTRGPEDELYRVHRWRASRTPR